MLMESETSMDYLNIEVICYITLFLRNLNNLFSKMINRIYMKFS